MTITVDTYASQEMQIASYYFPFPERRDLLIDEAKKSLPFMRFGESGGFGSQRRNLCIYILGGDWEHAKLAYYILVYEAIIETQYSMGGSLEKCAIALRRYVDPFGHSIEDEDIEE